MYIRFELATFYCIIQYRLSYEELVKEVDKWKEKVEETRQDMKEGEDPPRDVQEQMNEFLPVSVYI